MSPSWPLPPPSPPTLAPLQVFFDHIHEEEHLILVPLREELEDEQLQQLGRAFLEAKQQMAARWVSGCGWVCGSRGGGGLDCTPWNVPDQVATCMRQAQLHMLCGAATPHHGGCPQLAGCVP